MEPKKRNKQNFHLKNECEREDYVGITWRFIIIFFFCASYFL